METAHKIKYAATGILCFVLWYGLYCAVPPVSRWLTYELLQLTPQSSEGAAVEFFLYDTAKILLLLVFMVYLIGWLWLSSFRRRACHFSWSTFFPGKRMCEVTTNDAHTEFTHNS